MSNPQHTRRTTKRVLSWFIIYITFFTAWAFVFTPDIPATTVALLGSMIGIFGVVVKLYKSMREKDQEDFKDDGRF